MKRINGIVFVVLVFAFMFSGTVYSAEFIRVGSFNIANFGASKAGEYERSLVSLVNIIVKMDADVIALQEIEARDFGTEQVERLVKLLNKSARYNNTHIYDFLIASQHTGDETTAYLWREPVVLESDILLMEHERDPDKDEIPAFQREPHYALFSAKNYDFYLVNCHLYTRLSGPTSEGRGAEFAVIVEWLKELANGDEKDAIVVGDFNRFLNGKSAWKQLMVQGHDQWFRFPLLEAIKGEVQGFNPAKDEAPKDKYSTTTSKKKSIYDQVLISKGSYYEFTANPKLDVDVGIVAFDKDDQFKWATDSWHDAIKMLSDHRPVWIRMRVEQTDDDI